MQKGLEVLKGQLAKPNETGADHVKNLAGAMPVVSKGLIAAINAFKSGDNFTGASELMNISAALTPLVAGLPTAGGPPGMLIAAFFSVIAQILGQFAQQQESFSDKIIAYLSSPI